MELQAAQRFIDVNQAAQVAEGGVDNVLAALTKDPSSIFAGACPPNLDPARVTCTLEDIPTQVTPGATVLQGTRQIKIQVTGAVPTLAAPQAQQTIEVVADVSQASVFQWPLFADEVRFGIFGHTLVDGYNSTNGPYPYYGGAEHQRPILAQVRSNGKIYFDNSPFKPDTLWSDLMVGPGFVPASTGIQIAAPPGVHLYGAQLTAPSAIILPAVPPPAQSSTGSPYLSGDCAVTDSPQVFNIAINPPSLISVGANCKVTLQGNGSVYFDEITMGAQGTLRLDGTMALTTRELTQNFSTLQVASGAVMIHVTGDDSLVITGTVDNMTHIPANLIFVVDTTSSVDIMGPKTIYGVIYAPNAEDVFFHYLPGDAGQLFGSVVTKNLLFINGNWNIHYDQALRTIQQNNVSTTPVKIRLWREL